MTVHRKRSIETVDVASIAVCCKGCGTTISLPADKETNFDKLDYCPTCGDMWLGNIQRDTIAGKFKRFSEAFRDLRDEVKRVEQEKRGFRASLEIVEPDPVSSSRDV